VRPRAFLPQLDAPPTIVGSRVEAALARIAAGLVKKLLLADVLGAYVDQVWGGLGDFPAGNLLLAFYAYAFQIYFDFSGYTDVALGLAQLFGFALPENFDRPYLARSPREFWQRWHVTLSTWLRDYVYISFGGNRGTRARTCVNLLLTMLLGGLWHGAAWTFVAWGGYHGVLLVAQRLWGGRDRAADAGPGTLARLGTFHLVVLGWVFFRAPTLAAAAAALARLGDPGLVWVRSATVAALVLAVAAVLHVVPPAAAARERFVRLPPVLQGLAYGVATVAVVYLAPPSERFIYFQF
jgi:D-alanyl-lipoteichoic acid acyltransferase DltB (MBOAT superfamily)